MITKVWGKGSCQIAYPFQVVLPLLEFDFEFDFHKAIQEAQEGKINIQEVDDTIGDIFKHPYLDLASLLECKRVSHSMPSQNEATMLQACVEECTQDILTLKATINSLISNIAGLCCDLNQAMTQFGQKSSRRALCQNILSPVKYINHDVLEKIFLECFGKRDSGWPDPLEPPLQLASVCRRWQDIAYSMPQLWRNIYVNFEEPQDFGTSLKLATRWLERAGTNSNVSMILHIPDGTAIDFPPLADFLDCLSTSSIQITRLRSEVGEDVSPDHVSAIDLILKDRCATLEELKIGRGGPLDQTLLIEGVKRLYLFQIPESWLATPPNYKHLTVLRLVAQVHWDVVEWILVNCTNLERVFVSLSPVGAALTQSAKFQKLSRITIRHLVYLGIYNNATGFPDIPPDFISNFNFPSLRIFEYCAKQEAGASLGWLTALGFLGQLRRITLQCQFEVPEAALMQFFGATSSVEELSVYALRRGGNIFSFFREEFLSNPHLLPRLERLHIGHIGHAIKGLHTSYQKFVEAWLPLRILEKADSEDTTSNLRRTPSHLTFHHWNQAEDESHSELDTELLLGTKGKIEGFMEEQLRPPGGSGQPLLTNALELRFVRHILDLWLYKVPILFEMLPLSLDEHREFEVLGESSDSKWVAKRGPIYHVD
ncbi:hypothetical protein BDN72DRAFT_963685 [Pluteus cervinus]|uniref:Uncharacterized protein n=1 Tax=Pluteus cervinus TaxID=181527 RepID=A0ACD3AG30_9AGAR|nr:hypothetical protein BDN72DRAFT_963685 [Pluteus cervinus]